MNNTNSDGAMAFFKMAVAWLGTLLGGMTMQHVVMAVTLVYTVLQTYLLVRDRILRDKGCKTEGN